MQTKAEFGGKMKAEEKTDAEPLREWLLSCADIPANIIDQTVSQLEAAEVFAVDDLRALRDGDGLESVLSSVTADMIRDSLDLGYTITKPLPTLGYRRALSDTDDTEEPVGTKRVRDDVCTEIPPTIDHVQNSTIVVSKVAVADATFGGNTTYVGEPQLVLNGMSSLRTDDGTTLKLVPGTPVRICTRPVIPFNPSGAGHTPSVRIHFQLRVKGHASDCQCGACGCAFNLTNVAPSPCSCGTEVYDEGNQACVIM